MLNGLLAVVFIFHALGQLSAIGDFGNTNLYLFDIVTGVFSFTGIIYYLFTKSLKIPIQFLYFYLFSVVILISWLIVTPGYSAGELLTGAMYIGRFYVYLIAGVVVYNMARNKNQILYVENLIVFTGILIGVIGILQLIILPDFEKLDPGLGWDPHKNRLTSSFFDPNFTGAYLTGVLCVLLGRLSGKNRTSGAFMYATTVFISLTIFLTFSRSAWLMSAVVILIFGLFRNKKLLLEAVMLSFLAYYMVPRVQTRISGYTDPSDSARFRFISWQNSLEIINDHMWTGVGFNMYRYAQKDYGFLDLDSLDTHSGAGSDSSLLFVWATSGFFGLLLYIAGMLGLFYLGFKNRKGDGIILLSFIAGLLIESQFINSLFYPQIMLLWIILGVLYISNSPSRILP